MLCNACAKYVLQRETEKDREAEREREVVAHGPTQHPSPATAYPLLFASHLLVVAVLSHVAAGECAGHELGDREGLGVLLGH